MNLSSGRCRKGAWLYALALSLWGAATAGAASVSPLYDRGYSVLPEPQAVVLTKRDFNFGSGWRLELAGVKAQDVAVESLRRELKTRYGIALGFRGARRPRAGVVRLAVISHSVGIAGGVDSDRKALIRQAYKILLTPEAVDIRANTAEGLFYGVVTLIQLVRPEGKKYLLPAGEIIDWPDLELRSIYWDDAHHLERLEELKQAIRQAAFFKINGFALKLEGHFQYRSAPAVVEPYALTPAQLQELTRYGLRYYVQVIPYLDGPAHAAFILKHPEYARLRGFPQSNYEMCVTNPRTTRLLFGMYNDLIAANKGGKYFLLSTDEPYYVGMAQNAQCGEASRAEELGGASKLLTEFIAKTSKYLHDRGRTVIFWGEYPLKPEDIASLPSHLVNGEVYGPEFDPAFKAHGIRQMIYTSTQGEEPLFPHYFSILSWETFHHSKEQPTRLKAMMEDISTAVQKRQADLMGVIVAGWADAGLHPETFWAGYGVGTAAGWHADDPNPLELMASFIKIYYGPGSDFMARVYQLMSEGAEFWDDSWDWAPSAARKPIFGNSEGVYNQPKPASDQTLPLPAVPALPDLTVDQEWKKANDRRLQLVFRYMVDNGELLDLLKKNGGRVRFHRYNLEVFNSIAQLYAQNLEMILNVGQIYHLFDMAHDAAKRHRSEAAVADLDRALDIAQNVRRDRNRVLGQVTKTWYKSWYPRVEQANGRRFLHESDDVKDHRPDRTVDMSYLVYRELILPFGEWVKKIQSVRNIYALSNGIPERQGEFDWEDTKTIEPAGRAGGN